MDERYTHTTFDVAGELDERGRAWIAASRIGFAQGTSSEENTRRWWDGAAIDGQRWHAIHREPAWPGLGLDEVPVATFATMNHDVNVGGGQMLPSCFVLDVSVRASDRRQGLMRELMESALRRAANEGLALASLTATEATLYGRFGFGVATRVERVSVDLGTRFQLQHSPTSRVELADPRAIADVVDRLHDDFARTHLGAHQRVAMRTSFLSGEWDWGTMAPNTEIRAAVAIGDRGPVGAVSWKVSDGAAQVLDLVGDELALWQYLANLDLVESGSYGSMQAGSALRAALVDERVVSTDSTADQIWLRLLDVPKALVARGWDVDGTVTLLVSDPLAITDGCWRVVVSGGVAEVVAVDESEAEVSLGVRELAELYLGTGNALVLAAAGRITGDAEAVRRVAQMFTTQEPAQNKIVF